MTPIVSLEWDGNCATATIKRFYTVEVTQEDGEWIAVIEGNSIPEVVLFDLPSEKEALAAAHRWVEGNAIG